MSKKQWMVLLMLFVTYLLLGASIFYHIESRLEVEHVKQAKQERIEINALLHKHYMPNHAENQHEILEKLTQYCGKSVYNYTEGETDPLKWDFYNSFYFAYTVVSTIGYGNLAPTNMLSRILMIFYGLVGIPMNGILLSQLGEFFSLVFIRAHQKYKSYKKRQCDYPKKLAPLESRKAGLAAQIFMYLTPGFIMFIFFPAFLFSHYEGWTYDEAVYYAFVTLTTIGFGDYVAGQDNTKGSGVLFILYKTFLICWISFGLGYIVMIMTFIARGMRSKKITRLEHKLAMNLKHTQSKIWNEFNKEVNYLRRVFNELQLSKVKRVYVDECEYETPPAKFQRSSSFPDLRDLVYGGLENPAPPHPRRRANSEVVPMEDQVTRVVSETDLQRIDKTATFATHAMVQPAELLARLVNILGYIPPPDDSPDDQESEQPVGGQGEKEVLANDNSNWDTTWRIGNVPLSKPRSRAASEVRLETNNEANIHQQNGEWTWSGPAASRKIQELIKARRTGLSGIKDAKSKFRTLSLPKSVPKTLFPRWMMPFSNKKGTEDSNSKTDYSADNNDPQESYSTQTTANAYSSSTNDRRYSTTRPYFTHTGADLPSYLEGNNLLEEATLADFLRALTVLHTRVVTVPDDYVTRKPQRKMGTASLTPPKLPSLLALFSPPSGSSSTTQSNQNTVTAAQQPRRYSLMTTDNSGTSASNYNRRGSLALAPRLRRFSLRPVSTPATTPPPQSKPFFTNGRQSSDGQSPPPYSPTNSAFVVESPKEPLVQREGAPGVSSPVTSAPNIRRFSLRPAQIGVPPAPATPKSVQTKVMPRWKAGMLQRQIGQLSLQKRARAFSLSDVNVDGPDRGTSISPLVLSNAKIVTSSLKDTTGKATSKSSSSAVQKTVTIASPEREQPKVSDEIQQSSKPMSSVEQETIGWTNTLSPIPSVSSFDDSTNNPFVFTGPVLQPVTRNDSVVESKSTDFGGSVTGRQSIDSQLPLRKTYYDNKAFEGDSPTKMQAVPLDPTTSMQSTVESTAMATEGSGKDFSSRKTTPVSLPDNIPFVFNPIETGNQIPFVQAPSPSSSHHNEAINMGLQKCLLAKNSEEQLRDTPSRSPDEKISNLAQVNGKLNAQKVSSDTAKKDEQSFGRRVLDKDAKSTSRKVSTVSQRSTGTEEKPSRKTSSISIGTWADAQRQRKESTISQASVASSASSSAKHPDDKPRVSIDSYKPLLEVRVEKPSVNPFEQYKATMKLNQDDNTALTEVKVDKPAKESREDDYNFSPD